MGFGNGPQHLGALAALFEQAVDAIGLLTVHNHQRRNGPRARDKVTRKRLGARQNHQRSGIRALLDHFSRITNLCKGIVIRLQRLNEHATLTRQRT